MFPISPNMKRRITVQYARDDGTPGLVEGAPVWTASPDLASVQPADDGLSADVVHNGAVGELTLTITADGDLGAGVFPIVLSEMFDMRPPLGAVGGAVAVGSEEMTAAAL